MVLEGGAVTVVAVVVPIILALVVFREVEISILVLGREVLMAVEAAVVEGAKGAFKVLSNLHDNLRSRGTILQVLTSELKPRQQRMKVRYSTSSGLNHINDHTP